MTKNAVGEHFSLSLISGIDKNWMRRWGGGGLRVKFFFPSKTSCLTVPENFVGQTFRVSVFRVSKNFMLQRVMSQFFVELFCLTVPRNFVGKPFCAVFQKISGSE